MNGVIVAPGAIAFTRMPNRPTSTASDFVSIATAAFVIAYRPYFFAGASIPDDVTLMIDPPPCGVMTRTAAWQP